VAASQQPVSGIGGWRKNVVGGRSSSSARHGAAASAQPGVAINSAA